MVIPVAEVLINLPELELKVTDSAGCSLLGSAGTMPQMTRRCAGGATSPLFSVP